MIKRVWAKKFRSLWDIDVTLGPLTVLVGPNGAGKSNFVDVLRFVRDALRNGLDSALIDRHGISAIRHWSPKGRPFDVEIGLELRAPKFEGEYSFTLGSERRGEFRVKVEACRRANKLGRIETEFETHQGSWLKTYQGLSATVQPTVLVLPLASGLEPFKPLYDFLVDMGFYTIFPNVLREPQKPGNPHPLDEHGENLASVLRNFLKKRDSSWLPDLRSSLGIVVEGLKDFQVSQVGGYLVVKLKHDANGDRAPTFELSQESDGTLRLLGLLVALYQDPPRTLLVMEEPELNIHPGAMGLLCDVLREAARRSQILITTHSPDLIARFGADELRVVERVKGATKIGQVDEAQREAINRKLFSPGDLLRIEGLRREPVAQE